ncbi:cutinase-1 [Coleophoma crateriformis]|uniref:Cutinase n=1 Tax=Coleophoma crateriformis TaxID=565419 RepID=A0A3D8SHX4_9HELO|nr:cutinase-1 [Coleophoma crateriformis]
MYSLLVFALVNLAAALPAPAPAAAAGGCADMMVMFARGTLEAAPLGSLTGPPFMSAIQSKIGGASMSFQGVDYPADVPGFLAGGDAGGSKNMATMTMNALTACPNSKVVMSGYSQGGQLVHNAAKMMPAAMVAKVNSVVIFGDPDNGKPVTGVSAAKTKVICHQGDNICAGGDTILTPHLTYSNDAGTAAAFVAQMAGM